MKPITLLLPALLLLASCTTRQYQPFYKCNEVSGVITEMYANNVGGTTVVIGKYNVNFWSKDLDSTFVIGAHKTVYAKYFTSKIKR